MGVGRELGVRYPALPRGDGGPRLPRRHGGELARRHPVVWCRVRVGPTPWISTHGRAVRGDGGGASPLDQGQPQPERLDARLPDRGGPRVAGRGAGGGGAGGGGGGG